MIAFRQAFCQPTVKLGAFRDSTSIALKGRCTSRSGLDLKIPCTLSFKREITTSRPSFLRRGHLSRLEGQSGPATTASAVISDTEYTEGTDDDPGSPSPPPRRQAREQVLSDWSEGTVTHLGPQELPTPQGSRVKSAEYISSAVRPDQLPEDTTPLPEIAVIGRSNVGKSSLINALTHQKKGQLAHVSKTPGKTKTINHFLINKSWYLVDLPGYGFAKSAKTKKMEWFGFTSEYFLNRENLIMVLLLVDATVPTQQADVECLHWLAEQEIPVSVVFTKIDKRKKKVPKPVENILAFEKEMADVFFDLPPRIATSSASGAGKDKLLRYIASLRGVFEQDS